MADNRRFVQFPHPGGQHQPDVSGRKPWNPVTRSHARTFASLTGRALSGAALRSGPLWAWVEWEPEATAIRQLEQPDDRFPTHLWQPAWSPKLDYAGLHNTDPFVFGGFLYGNCKQGSTNSLVGLTELGAGTVILFGSAMPRWQAWVLDTVLVVRDYIDFNAADFREVLADQVPNAYWDIMLGPTFSGGQNRDRRFRLYRGATFDKPVDGMFSFFPCIPPGDRVGFPRPAIDLPPRAFTRGLLQGARGHSLNTASVEAGEIRALWNAVREQVEAAGLELGIHAAMPECD